jgi:hypothetical protein
MSSKWPYVAGIIDGEGTLAIYHSCGRYAAEVVIPNTSFDLMKWLVGSFGGRYNTFQPEDLHGYNRKLLYRWRPSGKKNREKFLLGILPYLVIKREQANILLEFERLGYGEQEKREELRKRCGLLNNGDESVTTNTLNKSKKLMGAHVYSLLYDDYNDLKIESEHIGDNVSGPVVTQESQ